MQWALALCAFLNANRDPEKDMPVDYRECSPYLDPFERFEEEVTAADVVAKLGFGKTKGQ